MYSIIIALIIIAAILLILIVLAQNPKGGGLNAGFGVSNQVLGVQRTTDFLEKGTWYLAILICGLTLATVFVVPKKSDKIETKASTIKPNTSAPVAPPVTAPAPASPNNGANNKKP